MCGKGKHYMSHVHNWKTRKKEGHSGLEMNLCALENIGFVWQLFFLFSKTKKTCLATRKQKTDF